MNGLNKTAKNIQGRTICAFGEACAWAVLSFVSKFRGEFEVSGAADEARRVKEVEEAETVEIKTAAIA